MKPSPNQVRLQELSERFNDLKAERRNLEQHLMMRIFHQLGGTSDELQKDRPPQKLEEAAGEACLEGARAIESDVDDLLSTQPAGGGKGASPTTDDLDEAASLLDELEVELGVATASLDHEDDND